MKLIQDISSALETNYYKKVVILDTDSFEFNEVLIDKFVNERCLCVITIGRQAEYVHDFVDEVAFLLNFESDDTINLDIDTRWESSLKEAVWQAQFNMFSDVKEVMKEIVILKSD